MYFASTIIINSGSGSFLCKHYHVMLNDFAVSVTRQQGKYKAIYSKVKPTSHLIQREICQT